MRRVLVVHYSQSGQLNRVVRSVVAPLQASDSIQVDELQIQMQQPFPFPWPFLRFFHIFPETVRMEPQALRPLQVDAHARYDLIILAYQVWFLSPSLPMTSFLATPEAQQLLRDTPVMTLVGCRNMWLMAQEKMKDRLQQLGARLLDHAVLTDECGMALSFLATPLWMFTGKQQPYAWLPKAGIAAADIQAAQRFGDALQARLERDALPLHEPVLRGLQAVTVNEKLIASERIGNRSFQLWSSLLIWLGPQGSYRRSLGLLVYILFLLCMIVTVVPVVALLKKLLQPFTRKRIARQKQYFAGPSGE